jgi:hypothetical protein
MSIEDHGGKEALAWLSLTKNHPQEEKLEVLKCFDPSPPWLAGRSSPAPQIHLSRWTRTVTLFTEIVVLLVVLGSDCRI